MQVSFEKNIFKWMINNVYGKAMDNLRKRISVKILSNKKDFLKDVSKQTFVSRKNFDKKYAAIQRN